MLALVMALIAAPASAQPSGYDATMSKVLERNLAGDFAAALEWAQKGLAIAERENGPQSHQAANAHLAIAIQQQSLGRLPVAEQHYRKGLSIQERLVPPDDPSLGMFASGLGGLMYGQARYEDAEPHMRRSLAIQEAFAARSGNATGLAVALYMLGSNYTYMARLEEARRLLERSLATFDGIMPQGGVQAAIVLNNLATNRQIANDYVAAAEYQLRAQRMFERYTPQNLAGIGKGNNNLGFLFRRAGNFEKAAEHYRLAIDQLTKAFPGGHADIATASINYGSLLIGMGQLADGEKLLTAALATRRRLLPADHAEIGLAHAELADLWIRRGNWERAVSELRSAAAINVMRANRQDKGRGTSSKNDIQQNAFLFAKLVKAEYRLSPDDLDNAFVAAQHAVGSLAAASLAQMASRSAKRDSALADLVRTRQDLVAAWHAADQQMIAALSAPQPASTDSLRRHVASLDTRITEIEREIATRFPDYASLANPSPLTITQARSVMSSDEALILFLDTPAYLGLPEETFAFVITATAARVIRSSLGTGLLAGEIDSIRCGLDFAGAWLADGSQCEKLTGTSYTREDDRAGNPLPFDAARAYELYRSLLGDASELIAGKHLLIVTSGPLSRLPFHVLLTEKPSPGKAADFASLPWLARSNAVTVLPAVSSLQALRRNASPSAAPEPFIGFGNPLLNGDCGPAVIPDACPDASMRVAETAPHAVRKRSTSASSAPGSVFRDGRGDLDALRRLCPLPETESELNCVARSLGASGGSLRLGSDMTESAIKKERLDRYRILHFATHGLLAGEMAELSALKAEPALVMTPPAASTEEDDGLLTASEIASLKLDADWVVMSACNTAASGTASAEALSGLARAFFYAGARALLVSHWPVDSYAATMLTSRTFAEMRADTRIGRAEATRRAMLALLSDPQRKWAAHPSVWAPFVVVGEGGSRAGHR